MKVIVQDLATEYEDAGEGPTVLFLHGWQDDLHTFDSLVERLSGSYRIVRLDLPGFGETELPVDPFSLDTYVDFVAAFVEKKKLDLYAMIGHSFGGRILLKGLAREVFSPKRVVLIASAGMAERNTMKNNMLKALAQAGKLATLPLPASVRNSLRESLYKKIRSDYAAAGPLRETLVNIISENLSAAASSVKVPALLIWGSADTETPFEEGVRLSESISKSRLEIVQAAGHFVHKEQAASVAALIQEFLA